MNPSTRRLRPAASGLSLSRRPGAAEGPGWAWWLVLAAAALYLTPYPAASLDPQGARALEAAWKVASGHALPVHGPAFGQGWRLGPLWAYVLSPVVAAGASLTVAGVLLGALAAAKPVLAYICGRRLVDWRLGLAWALLLVVPGWASLEQIRLTPANIGAAAVLVWLYCALRTQQTPAPSWLASTALFAALAAHVHIGLLVLTPLTLGIALYYLYRARAAGLVAIGVAALAWLVPWMPTLLVGSEAQAADAGAGVSTLDPGALLLVPELIWRVLADGTALAANHLLPAWAGGGVWLTLAVIAGSLSVAGLLPALIECPRTLGIMVGLSLVLAAGAALSGDPRLGVDGVLGLSALLSGVLALGLRAWLAAYNPWSRGFASLTIAGLLAGGVCFSATAIERAHHAGQIRLPGGGESPMDAGGARAVALFPLWAHDLLAERLCAAEVPAVLHGDLAGVTARAQAIGVRLRCGRRADVHIGGRGPGGVARHIAGFPRASWQALDAGASAALAGFVLTERVRPVHPRRGPTLLDDDWTAPRAVDSPSKANDISLTAGRSSWVVVSDLSPAGGPAGIDEVLADRRVVDVERRSSYSRFYRCRVCAGSLVRWQLNLRSRAASTVEVLALPAPGREGHE